jgi:Dolichyl-phosphate-mannose-protein mannosyltransferase
MPQQAHGLLSQSLALNLGGHYPRPGMLDRFISSVRVWPASKCRWTLAVVLAVGFFAHLAYLSFNCPIDLAADEAHYWDWSRDLDWAYYSKGPLVAYINWLSSSLLGHSMVVVRLPALVLGVGTCLCLYWLTTILFQSERLALAVVLIVHTIPLFVAGSMLMTIDPPYIFCWTLATCFAAKAIFQGKSWCWIAAGVAIGVGLLAKYAAPLWFVNVVVFAVVMSGHRKLLWTWQVWAGVLIGLMFFIPPVVWNVQNDWVTFRHVGRQIGVNASEGAWYANVPLLIGTQAGVLGGVFAVFVVAGVVSAIKLRRQRSAESERVMFLVCFGLPFFLFCLYRAFKVEIEPNWPAPTFVTLTVLGTWWIVRQMKSQESWQKIKGFVIAQVVIGLIAGVLIHRSDVLYPIAGAVGYRPDRLDRQIIKMRGNQEFGDAVSRELAKLNDDAFVLTRSYQDASLLGFYVAGQPKVLHAGSYLLGKEQTRQSQFDLWKDRDLTDPKWIGRDAVFVGSLDEGGVIRGAFESIESAGVVEIRRWGYVVRSKSVYVGRGFRGLTRPLGNAY